MNGKNQDQSSKLHPDQPMHLQPSQVIYFSTVEIICIEYGKVPSDTSRCSLS